MPTLTKESAIKLFGSQAGLARALGISAAAVAQWPAGKPIPALRQFQIEELSSRALREKHANG